MTQAVETGAIFYAACPACGDELHVGWSRPGDTVPCVVDPAKRRAAGAGADEQDVVHGPVDCACGAVRLRFNPATGRARLEWPDGQPQPALGNQNVH